jgi:hypothetical protein
MKESLFLSLLLASMTVSSAQLLIVDQQANYTGNGYYSIVTNAPIGQTFTPATNKIGFVELQVYDGGPATLRVNLRKDGITGPIIGTSRFATIPISSFLRVFFDFGTNVPVIPEQLYCIEPVLKSGEDCRFVYYHYGYPRGEGIVNGQPSTSIYSDMRFREGVLAQFAQFSAFSKRKYLIEGTVSGAPGQDLVIEYSPNAVTWVPMQTNRFESNIMSFVDSNCFAPQMFYRAYYSIP